jgi:hypothetical protein
LFERATTYQEAGEICAALLRPPSAPCCASAQVAGAVIPRRFRLARCLITSSSRQVFFKASLLQSKSSSKQVARRFAAAFNNHLIVKQNNVPGATDPIWMTNDARR